MATHSTSIENTADPGGRSTIGGAGLVGTAAPTPAAPPRTSQLSTSAAPARNKWENRQLSPRAQLPWAKNLQGGGVVAAGGTPPGTAVSLPATCSKRHAFPFLQVPAAQNRHGGAITPRQVRLSPSRSLRRRVGGERQATSEDFGRPKPKTRDVRCQTRGLNFSQWQSVFHQNGSSVAILDPCRVGSIERNSGGWQPACRPHSRSGSISRHRLCW